jgi:hypothetical protein
LASAVPRPTNCAQLRSCRDERELYGGPVIGRSRTGRGTQQAVNWSNSAAIAPRRDPARAVPALAAAWTLRRPSSPTATPSAHPVTTPSRAGTLVAPLGPVMRPVRGEGGHRGRTSSQPSTGGVPQPARGSEKSAARDTSHVTKQRLSERLRHVAALPPQTVAAVRGSSGRCRWPSKLATRVRSRRRGRGTGRELMGQGGAGDAGSGDQRVRGQGESCPGCRSVGGAEQREGWMPVTPEG